jgi:DNA ligase-associated metallophosphoesterase
LPERAAYVPEGGWLLVADAHFGKAHAFRRLGVPVPGGTTAHNLALLDRLIASRPVRAVAFLGDLLHARHGRGEATLTEVAAWRVRHAALRMVLVRGNHDSRAGDPPSTWGIEVVDEPWDLSPGPWSLCHHPQAVPGRCTLAGHVHPAVRVGRGADSLRLPCFHLTPQGLTLPAFGAFTGSHTVAPQPGDRVFAIAGEAVREVPVLTLTA